MERVPATGRKLLWTYQEKEAEEEGEEEEEVEEDTEIMWMVGIERLCWVITRRECTCHLSYRCEDLVQGRPVNLVRHAWVLGQRVSDSSKMLCCGFFLDIRDGEFLKEGSRDCEAVEPDRR